MTDEPRIIPGFESSEREIPDGFKSIWEPGDTLVCNACGRTDRPLRKMYKTLNSSARICDLCYERYVKMKQMVMGVNNEFDRQLTLPVERKGQCTHCGREVVAKAGGYPDLLCRSCVIETRQIAQEEKSRGVHRFVLHN